MKKNILLIVGSLRKDSFNKQVANYVKELLDDTYNVSFLDYSKIPFMDQDNEFPVNPEVARVRKEVIESAGLWFFTPEYSAAVSGVLKNLLDILSRPIAKGEKDRAANYKKAAISGAAGKSGAQYSIAQLKDILEFIRMEVMENKVGIVIDNAAWDSDVLTISEEDKKRLEKQAEDFKKFIG